MPKIQEIKGNIATSDFVTGNIISENASGEKKVDLRNEVRIEAKILELLNEPTPRDNLIRQAKLSTEKANSLFSILEIKGLIKEVGGKIYRDI